MSNVIVKRNGQKIKATLNGSTPGKGSDGTAVSGITQMQGQLETLSGLIQRANLANLAGIQYAGQRDLYAVFGYKKQLKADDFLAKYIRQDITTRIIDAPPSATWSNPPTIKDKNLNIEWQKINRKVKLWPAINRADRLSRMNTFSLLLFGFNDSGQLQRQLNPNKVDELLYVRAVGARLVEEMTFITDPRSPRYGFPETYRIRAEDPTTKSASAGQTTVKGLKDIVVHHSRVVHIVENALEDEVFGIPIIEKVYNLLDDLLKIAGGTAETYWLTGNRGLQADIDKEMEIQPDDAKALSDEIDEYMHQLRRFVRTRGVDLKVLDSKTPNPKEIFSMIVNLISGTTGIPTRILLGSEAGQLASEQDRANWAERISERRVLFAEPQILEPMVDKFQEMGILSEGEVEFVWPSAFIQNPLEIGQTQAQTARAIGNISRQTGNKAPMQLTSREEARDLLGFDGDLDESDIIEPPPEPTPQAPQVPQVPPKSTPDTSTTP